MNLHLEIKKKAGEMAFMITTATLLQLAYQLIGMGDFGMAIMGKVLGYYKIRHLNHYQIAQTSNVGDKFSQGKSNAINHQRSICSDSNARSRH